MVSYENLYNILTDIAKSKTIIYYKDLSSKYILKFGGEKIDPHNGWNIPLGKLNQIVYDRDNNAPPISAIVLSKATNRPGSGFWGSAKNVPKRPPSDEAADEKWDELVKKVYEYKWPRFSELSASTKPPSDGYTRRGPRAQRL
jgi:hypothetical protein